MKTKINTKSKEFKIKLIISAVLFFALVLSFFFAKKLEDALGFHGTSAPHLSSYAELSGSDFAVEYVDVGQGNCTFIRFPDGKTALVDSGSEMYSGTVENFLNSRGVECLDYVIATHADSDHIGGFGYLFSRFEVKNVFRPFQIAGMGTSAENFAVDGSEDLAEVYSMLQEKYNGRSKISRVTTQAYRNFISSIYSETYHENGQIKQCSVTVFYDGLKIDGTNYSIEFFAPLVRDDNISLSEFSNTGGYATVGYGVTNSNDNSAIFLLTVENYTFLFSGDASFADNEKSSVGGFEEYDFVQSLTAAEREKLSGVSVYLAGHHGSKFSSGEALLETITPMFVVVSVAKYNDYGHPNPEAVERLNKYKTSDDVILETWKLGTLSFGRVGDALRFACTYSEEIESYHISWYLVSSLAFLFVIMVTISIKPFRRKSQSC